MLEQCINAGDELITRELVLEYTGGAGDDFYIELTDAIRTGEAGTALADIDSMVEDRQGCQAAAFGLATAL